ncbi:oligosaccharide flippase family protein [Endozoicomonas atrinae]|uniref:oligosaccharide flippase family protein n=1 Tax=Endozoicomonas atrinae TaxID=1333660 RepID=UPI003AFFBD77
MGTWTKVLPTLFEQLQDNQRYLVNTFMTASGILALLFIPASSILIVYSENIINIIYGEKWLAMVPLFQMLIFGAIVSAMSVIVGDLIKSQGVIYKEIASNITALIILISFSVWLYPIYGVLGVAVSYALGQVTLLLCQIYILSRLINMNYFYYFRIYLFPLFLSVIFVLVSSCINGF